jgi:hypothetical protein
MGKAELHYTHTQTQVPHRKHNVSILERTMPNIWRQNIGEAMARKWAKAP